MGPDDDNKCPRMLLVRGPDPCTDPDMPSSTLPPIASFDNPRLEALIETMYLAASADGEFSAEERQEFNRSVEALTDRCLTGAALEEVVRRIEEAARESGREARLVAVRDRLDSLRERKVALSLALQVMAADGILRTSERELILGIADAFEIDPDDAAAMVSEVAP